MKMQIQYVEFYITNVCNLSCDGCNRFNNHKFTGHQKWEKYKDIYFEWAKQLDIGSISILGGEPLYNPDYMKWLQGIQNMWPNSTLETVTNGYRLDQIDGLYSFVLKHKEKISLCIGIHNKKNKQFIMNKVKSFLTAPLTYQIDNSNVYQQKIKIVDANGVKVTVEYNWWFHQGALINLPDTNKFTLHNSDVDKAHNICHSKFCHHFMDGKLYKCGAVALFPEFAQQHDMVLSVKDRKLMNNYRPMEITDSLEVKRTFIKNLSNSIPQCQFCPEEYVGKQIYSEEKRIIFKNNKL